MQNAAFVGFSHCVTTSGDCRICNGEFLKCMNECISVREGKLTMRQCTIRSASGSLAGIVFESRTERARLDSVTVTNGRIGALMQGDFLLENCVIERCKEMGVVVDSNDRSLFGVVKGCRIERCKEGIHGKSVDLSVVDSSLKYCDTAISALDSAGFQCIRCQIHACHSLGILCQRVMTVRINENCIYDCRDGVTLAEVRYCQFHSNCVAYVRESILLFRSTIVCL